MPKAAVEAVIFDLGRVLLDFDHQRAAERIAVFSDRPAAEAFKLFFDSPLTARFESGRISPRDFFSRVKARLNLRLKYASFVPIWNEIFFFTPQNKDVYRLAKSLRKRYKVALVSNINILHLEYVKRAFPVLGAFDIVIASCRVGAIKPHRAIYQRALASLRTCAKKTFYTDDRKELVAGARALGFQGFVFKGLGRLRRDLLSAGVHL